MEGGAVGHILKGALPGTLPARLGLIWFRGEDLKVKVYDVRRTDGCKVMAKAHMAFGQVIILIGFVLYSINEYFKMIDF
jgi:hypothetical protein